LGRCLHSQYGSHWTPHSFFFPPFLLGYICCTGESHCDNYLFVSSRSCSLAENIEQSLIDTRDLGCRQWFLLPLCLFLSSSVGVLLGMIAAEASGLLIREVVVLGGNVDDWQWSESCRRNGLT
jgi:hypothetical protein